MGWWLTSTGRASLIDGDTLEIHGERIRLWGIDAPEIAQFCRTDDSDLYRCGAKAANDLDAFRKALASKAVIAGSSIEIDTEGAHSKKARHQRRRADRLGWYIRNPAIICVALHSYRSTTINAISASS